MAMRVDAGIQGGKKQVFDQATAATQAAKVQFEAAAKRETQKQAAAAQKEFEATKHQARVASKQAESFTKEAKPRETRTEDAGINADRGQARAGGVIEEKTVNVTMPKSDWSKKKKRAWH